MKILAHICCGPCACGVIDALINSGHEATGYFYNPNIQPYKEWKARKHALYEYANKKKLEMIWSEEYNLEGWLRGALEAGNRHEYCYKTRIDAAAREASARGFDAFTTTLLVSPHQEHLMIKGLGEKAAKENNVEFFYIDFRENYEASVCASRELELYRQKYCGCIFSERERYQKKK